jgi:response regulator RpfG family c-di-GMP phosphodiesterase
MTNRLDGGRRQTLLVVDDDETILLLLTLMFRREGYRVLTGTRAEEGLAHLERERVALVISDQRLPTLSGNEFLRLVRQRWPDTIRIIITAQADIASATAAINDAHVYRYVTKPWDSAELLAIVRDSMRFYDLQCENRRLLEVTNAQSLELRRLNEDLERKVAQRTEEIETRNHELENNLLDIIRLLGNAQEMRHTTLVGRAQRVAQAARWVAADLDVPPAEQYDIEIAATLYNIGKLSLPDRLLEEEGAGVTRGDRALLSQSPLLGEALLSSVPRLRAAARIIRHQNEWYNGQGFPDGLSGDAIPLGARIIAVAEAYTQAGTREALKQGEGRRFDPRVLESFGRYLDEQRRALQGIELRLLPTQLTEGMTLSRDLYTRRGLLLATGGKLVDPPTLEKIRNFHRVDPIEGWIYARS